MATGVADVEGIPRKRRIRIHNDTILLDRKVCLSIYITCMSIRRRQTNLDLFTSDHLPVSSGGPASFYTGQPRPGSIPAPGPQQVQVERPTTSDGGGRSPSGQIVQHVIPAESNYPPTQQYPPQTTYENAQELATSAYTSPVGPAHQYPSGYQSPPPPTDYASSAHPDPSQNPKISPGYPPLTSHPIPQPQQQQAHHPHQHHHQQHQPLQDGYANYSRPPVASTTYPPPSSPPPGNSSGGGGGGGGGGGYPVLANTAPPPPSSSLSDGRYQAYGPGPQAPDGRVRPQSPPSNNPNDFYRQQGPADTNEMFLPIREGRI